ncbi:Zinc finger protein plagl1 [Oleoguttula sp. CCFEE 5521]
MRFHIVLATLLRATLVTMLPLNGPPYPTVSNDVAAHAELDDTEATGPDADLMEWEMEARPNDSPQTHFADPLAGVATTDPDSLDPGPGSDNAESELGDLLLEDYFTAAIEDSTIEEATCIFPARLTCAEDYFTGNERLPLDGRSVCWPPHLLDDPHWTEFCETRASADAHAAAVISDSVVTAAHMDAFNADVDRNEIPGDGRLIQPHPVPEQNGWSPQDPADIAVQPSIEHTPIQEQEYLGTVQDAVEGREYEAQHTGPDGLHGHRSGPGYVVDQKNVDGAVAGGSTRGRKSLQPIDHDRQAAKQRWLLLMSRLRERLLYGLRDQLRDAVVEAGSGRVQHVDTRYAPDEAGVARRKQDMIDVQEKKGKIVACDRCPRRFKTKPGMLVHQKKNECNKYLCGIGDCPFHSYEAKTVERHRQTHNKTGTYEIDNPYPCEQCTQRFPRKDHLPRHSITAHPPGPTQVPSLEGTFDSAAEEARHNIDTIMSDIARAVPNGASDMDPEEYAMLIAQIMAEDLKTDLCKRNKRPEPNDGHNPETTVGHRNRAQSGSGGGIPPIGDFPVRPIDNADDTGCRLPSSSRPRPCRRTETGTGGGSSSHASSSQHRSSQHAEDDAGRFPSGPRRWSPYASVVPPESRRRRRATERRGPGRWDVHSILPDEPDDEASGSDEDQDAENEAEGEHDRCGG